MLLAGLDLPLKELGSIRFVQVVLSVFVYIDVVSLCQLENLVALYMQCYVYLFVCICYINLAITGFFLGSHI